MIIYFSRFDDSINEDLIQQNQSNPGFDNQISGFDAYHAIKSFVRLWMHGQDNIHLLCRNMEWEFTTWMSAELVIKRQIPDICKIRCKRVFKLVFSHVMFVLV